MDYPCDVLHIFAENANTSRHNHQMMQSISGDLQTITAINYFPENVSNQKINKVLNCNQIEAGGLTQVLEIKVDARVLQMVNTDLQERIVNRQMGILKHISQDTFNSVIKIYIKFDNNKAELKNINTENFAKQHFWVPIEKTEVDIRIKIISTKTSSSVTKRT